MYLLAKLLWNPDCDVEAVIDDFMFGYYGRSGQFIQAHFDLLHECRRAYKDRLPNCRLGTLESEILHQPRTHDLPGREVPEAYHTWVRTGDARTMVEILRHNHRDLVSMAFLVAILDQRAREGR